MLSKYHIPFKFFTLYNQHRQLKVQKNVLNCAENIRANLFLIKKTNTKMLKLV